MTMIAYAFLQHRRLATAGEKKNQRAATSVDFASECERLGDGVIDLGQRPDWPDPPARKVTFDPGRWCRMLPSSGAAMIERPMGGDMTMLKIVAVAAAIGLLGSVSASAQAPAPPPPYGPSITIEAAKKAMAAAEAEAAKNKWNVVITIVDAGGHPVMMHRADDVQYASIRIAEGKARTAVEFRRPTKALDDAVSGGGAGLRFLAIDGLMPLEGGIPIVVGGKIVGGIGVSGVAAKDDAQIARAGAAALQ